MSLNTSSLRLAISVLTALTLLTACGGGGSSSSSTSSTTTPPPQALKITTPPILPGTLQNHAYTTTLVATGGLAALKWSISPVSPTTLFVDGLSIDPNTGVLSGTPTFSGTAGFVAQVSDGSRTAAQGFTLTSANPLQAAVPETFAASQYYDIGYPSLVPLATGGVYPLTYTLTSNCLPAGLRLDSAFSRIVGAPMSVGTYLCGVTIQDSYSPPEIVSGQVTIVVSPPAFSVTPSIPQKMLLNRPFSGRVIATGGIPPYHFSLKSGSVLPPGLSPIEPNSGQLQGTPNASGAYTIQVNVSDSSSPPQTISWVYPVTVASPVGRNDSPATATPIDNGAITASISPYIDPPGNAPTAGDTDYYKLVSLSGAVVHIETQAQRWRPNTLLDTVIEVVDGNNSRFNTCRQPGDTSTAFSSSCINDDISASPHVKDSALDFKVPGAANAPTTFYVHVLDWRGDARPDMWYTLQISGAVPPLAVTPNALPPAARGFSYSQQLSTLNASGNVAWSVTAGTLPPGLTLAGSGLISGTATTDGMYPFTVKASDSSNPPQTATAQESIQVVEPVKITSSPTLPDACVNRVYSASTQTTGGLPPLQWSFVALVFSAGITFDQNTGVYGGVPDTKGTFHGSVGVGDATLHTDSQQISLTVKQCP